MDVFGFRIVVRSVPECYHALGVVHSVFKPLDGRFRDFIAIPKANGYQSLHTVLFGPYGSPIEVQIRTEEMDLIAERGIAAHWAYKHGGTSPNSAQSRAHSWIANLLESQRATGSSLEFLENVKVDLFPDEVYLFTPKGDILSLPRNATALDFAYAVHTDVGNHAVAARVDKKLVPLRTKLASGQKVEVITAQVVGAQAAVAGVRGHRQGAYRDPPPAQAPGARGRGAARPSHARSRAGGHAAPRSTACRPSGWMRYLAELPLSAAGSAAGRHRAGQPHAGPGRAGAGAGTGAAEEDPAGAAAQAAVPQQGERILITGNERGVITFASCCMPIPGDEIMGYHTAGRGIVVHRLECPNVADYRKSPERWVAIGWDREIAGDFQAALLVAGRESSRRAGAGRRRDRAGRIQHRWRRIPRARQQHRRDPVLDRSPRPQAHRRRDPARAAVDGRARRPASVAAAGPDAVVVSADRHPRAWPAPTMEH